MVGRRRPRTRYIFAAGHRVQCGRRMKAARVRAVSKRLLIPQSPRKPDEREKLAHRAAMGGAVALHARLTAKRPWDDGEGGGSMNPNMPLDRSQTLGPRSMLQSATAENVRAMMTFVAALLEQPEHEHLIGVFELLEQRHHALLARRDARARAKGLLAAG